jgi:hypothetical protein
MLILGLFMMHFNLLLGKFTLALSLSMPFGAVHSPIRRAHSDTGTNAGLARQDNQRV